MVYFQLFYEFFKIGLFAIGGGLATIPFLYELTEKYDWISSTQLADLIAVSESTPGPIGINIATYAGYHGGGIWGGILAPLAIVTPAVIIIFLIAKALEKFRENELVEGAFAGIRPAVAALIGLAVYELFKISVLNIPNFEASGVFTDILILPNLILFGIMLPVVFKTKFHPLAYIVVGAIIGVIFKM